MYWDPDADYLGYDDEELDDELDELDDREDNLKLDAELDEDDDEDDGWVHPPCPKTPEA